MSAAALKPNPGYCPAEAEGRRVRVVLNNGTDTASREPQGWPADGRFGVNWARDGHPFSIASYKVIG